MLQIFNPATPFPLQINKPFFHVGLIKLRICSEGHAQLKPSITYRSSIILDSFARQLSNKLDIQDFLEKSCSITYLKQSCWRQQNGHLLCKGAQKNFQIWTSIPSLLIFELEVIESDIKAKSKHLPKFYFIFKC